MNQSGAATTARYRIYGDQEMKDTFLIRETLGGVIAYEHPDYMVKDDHENKHSYDLDTEKFTVHIELSVSDEPCWKTAGITMLRER